MNSLAVETKIASIQNAALSEDTLTLELDDGRTISVPLAWYPRLLHGTQEERDHWHLIGSGKGIHWPDLDEDVSNESIIFGKPSLESQQSFQQWLEKRSSKS